MLYVARFDLVSVEGLTAAAVDGCVTNSDRKALQSDECNELLLMIPRNGRTCAKPLAPAAA